MGNSHRRYFLRGVGVTIASLLIVAVTFASTLGIAYDGSCGSFFPGLSARQSRSAWEYATGDLVAIAVLLAVGYLPLVLGLLILPPFLWHLIDLR